MLNLIRVNGIWYVKCDRIIVYFSGSFRKALDAIVTIMEER